MDQGRLKKHGTDCIVKVGGLPQRRLKRLLQRFSDGLKLYFGCEKPYDCESFATEA